MRGVEKKGKNKTNKTPSKPKTTTVAVKGLSVKVDALPPTRWHKQATKPHNWRGQGEHGLPSTRCPNRDAPMRTRSIVIPPLAAAGLRKAKGPTGPALSTMLG